MQSAMSDPAATAQVRAYTRADRDAVLELQARVFGAEAATSVANWTWEYDENPFQVVGVPLGWIAEIDGRMAGYYGMLPLRLCVDGRFVLALCGADFCVDEAWRGRGLGTLLTRCLLQAARGASPVRDVGDADRGAPAEEGRAVARRRHHRAVVVGVWRFLGWGRGCRRHRDRRTRRSGARRGPRRVRARTGASPSRRAVARRRLLRVALRRLPDRIGEADLCVLRAGPAVRGVAVLQCDRAAGRAFLLELLHRPDDRDACTSLLRDALALAGPSGAHELYAFHRVPTARAVLAAHGFVSVSQGAIVPLLDLPVTTSDGGPSLADWYVAPGDDDFLLRVGSGAPR